jgi:ribosomal protein L33
VSYTGKNSRTCTQRIEIWRWTTSAWVQLQSQSVGTSEVAVSSLAPTGALADYVSGTTGDGELRIRIRCTTSTGSFYSSGDLMRIAYDRP